MGTISKGRARTNARLNEVLIICPSDCSPTNKARANRETMPKKRSIVRANSQTALIRCGGVWTKIRRDVMATPKANREASRVNNKAHREDSKDNRDSKGSKD